MTLDTLQAAMIASMKTGDKFRKGVISTVIARVKNTAIDNGCRDNIPEDMVNAELLKAKKITQEMIDTCPVSRADLLENYKKQMEIINEFAPSLISDRNRIMEILRDEYEGAPTKKDIMKFLNTVFRGRMEMKAAAEVVDFYIDYKCNAKVVPQ